MRRIFFYIITILATCFNLSSCAQSKTAKQQAFAKQVIDVLRNCEIKNDATAFFELYPTIQLLKDNQIDSRILLTSKENYYQQTNGYSVLITDTAEIYKRQFLQFYSSHYQNDGKGVLWNKIKYTNSVFTPEATDSINKGKLFSAYIFFTDGNEYNTSYGIRINHITELNGKYYCGAPLQVCYANDVKEYDMHQKEKETGNYPQDGNSIDIGTPVLKQQ